MRLRNVATLTKLRKMSKNERKREKHHAPLTRKTKRVLAFSKDVKMKMTSSASNIFLNIVASTKIEDALSTSHSY